MTSAPAASGSVSPVLGFVGLGLAVLGTVLACVPAVFGVGVVVLLAGFVVSLVGLFRKGAVKWPSVVGMIVAVVGGAIGTVVLVVSLLANLAGPVDPIIPTDTPSTTSTDHRIAYDGNERGAALTRGDRGRIRRRSARRRRHRL
ncbi:MAG: hypothetical protein JF592_09020 [Microbacterium sp.]|uniref:hypothetical protein n=1 Tax=Microbacterium sp. TaxID=51671 RepID=UPI001D728FC3|nr:hypothetical protein [Microbacterium sp.]MBW8762709.1 hypothetical protein [Microbacterium sp.]